MSYIQIEIGGKLRGLKFNQMAATIVSDKVIAGNLISGAYGLLYGGLIANCYVKGEEPDFTFEEACDWADELDNDTWLKIKTVWESTQQYKRGQAYVEEQEAAKKKELPKDKVPKSTKPKA